MESALKAKSYDGLGGNDGWIGDTNGPCVGAVRPRAGEGPFESSFFDDWASNLRRFAF